MGHLSLFLQGQVDNAGQGLFMCTRTARNCMLLWKKINKPVSTLEVKEKKKEFRERWVKSLVCGKTVVKAYLPSKRRGENIIRCCVTYGEATHLFTRWTRLQ